MLELTISFFVSIIAAVISDLIVYFVCKWLDRYHR